MVLISHFLFNFIGHLVFLKLFNFYAEIQLLFTKMSSASGGLCPPDPLARGFAQCLKCEWTVMNGVQALISEAGRRPGTFLTSTGWTPSRQHYLT